MRNTGRGGASITGWGIRFDDSSHIPGHAQRIPFNPKTPFALGGGESETFHLALRPTVAMIAKHGVPAPRRTTSTLGSLASLVQQDGARLGCRAFVSLGTGDEEVSRDLGHVRVLHAYVQKLVRPNDA